MKTEQTKEIEQYGRHACLLAVAAAVVIAVLRIALTPIAFDEPLPYGIALFVTGGLLAFLLALSGIKYIPSIAVEGRMARFYAATAAVTGGAMVVFSLVIVYEFHTYGVLPYPDRTIASGVDRLFFHLLVAAGLAAGALFLWLAVCWWRAGVTVRKFHPLLALAPVLWSWMRLIRYITSYVSSLGLFRNLYDLGTIVFEMLFFVLLARYVSGMGDKASRFFFGVSLCTGLLCTVSGAAQVVFFFLQDAVSFETCALVTAPDFSVALLAFATAFSQAYGKAYEEPSEPENEEQAEVEEDPDDGEGAEYLISDQWFAVYDPEEDEPNN